MKTLARITVVFAVIVLCAVGFKIGYYEFTHSSKFQTAVAPSANMSAPVPTYAQKTETESATQAEDSFEKLALPKEFIIYSAEESKGTPIGSTTDEPELSASVFVGDSVSLGFSRYCARKGIMKETAFLTAGSYAVHYALSSDMSETKGFNHPLYKGVETPLKQAIEQIKPKNVYFCLGINDISRFGVEGTVKNYCKLINFIWEIDPEIHVYIVSTTFMVETAQKTNLNNLNLANLNHNMKRLCEVDERLDYIDIMSGLQDEKFALAAKYCSDEFIHQTNEAYEIWAQKLGAE